jgi:hypothetical protein
MKMRLAVLGFVIGDNHHINIIPGVGLSITLFFIFLALTLTSRNSMVSKSWKLRFGVCHANLNIHKFDGNTANGGFTTRNLSHAWSGKTTEGLASPSDCHKAAKIMSDEDAQ